jgi:parallel beta helix pectate lyase-like protein
VPSQLSGFALALVLLVAAAGPVFAVVRNVPADFPTIQAALDASSAGDAVVVAPGSYAGPSFRRLHDGVSLVSSHGPAVTVLTGNHQFTAASFESVGTGTRLEGFTITGGLALNGGGAYLHNASPEIRRNIIAHNEAVLNGGGVCIDGNGLPLIVNNTIYDNQAQGGCGGGIECTNSARGVIDSNIVIHNEALCCGGGICLMARSSTAIRHNTVAFNQAGSSGGAGVYLLTSSPTIASNIVAFNAPYGIRPSGGGVPIYTCNDVYGNLTADIQYPTSPIGTSGNISKDPKFCDPEGIEMTIFDDSPCASANGGCGGMGAAAVGCSVTKGRRVTWAGLKAIYR